MSVVSTEVLRFLVLEASCLSAETFLTFQQTNSTNGQGASGKRSFCKGTPTK